MRSLDCARDDMAMLTNVGSTQVGRCSVLTCDAKQILSLGETRRRICKIPTDRVAQRATATGTSIGCAFDQQHNLAFRWFCFVMRQQFRRPAAPELFKLFRQLAGNAQLPLWHNFSAHGQSFAETIWRFEEYGRVISRDNLAQFTFALATFDRQKAAKT